MSRYDVNKAYISPYDELFHQFDKKHNKSASQLKEIKKYTRIFSLRDGLSKAEEKKELLER